MARSVARIALSIQKAQSLISQYPRSSLVVLSADLLGLEGVVGPAKEKLDKDYLDLIARLGKEDGTKYWWANSLSEKNELLSPFFKRLAILYAFRRWLDRNPSCDCIIVCDAGLVETVCSLLRQNYRVITNGLGSMKAVKILRNVCRYFLKLKLLFWQEIYRMVLSRCYMRRAQPLRSLRKARVIKSWVDHRSYRSGEYQDAYFPNLLEYLKKQNIPYVLLADIIQDYRQHLRNIARDRKTVIVPIDYFFSFWDLCKALVFQWIYRPRVRRGVSFSDMDVTPLIRDELSESFFSGRFFNNILYYFKIKRLAQMIEMHSFIYTFENYAWEKMCLTALKECAKGVKTIGFQHAFIAKNSFKYFLGEGEVPLVPSPDTILTMGDVTKRILNTYGRWPHEMLKTGCALRQANTANGGPVVHSRCRDILVVFTMTRDESVRILEFIFKSGLDRYPGKVYLRFHPQTPVQEVLRNISFDLPVNFIISNAQNLNDDLKRAGVVLYTQTTVGLEALINGIPGIYLDVNSPLNLDPLFECGDLTDQASNPQELIGEINKLLDLPEEDYTEALARARMYLKDYFYPVNEEALALFAQ